jgi:hypothetical protein
MTAEEKIRSVFLQTTDVTCRFLRGSLRFKTSPRRLSSRNAPAIVSLWVNERGTRKTMDDREARPWISEASIEEGCPLQFHPHTVDDPNGAEAILREVF